MGDVGVLIVASGPRRRQARSGAGPSESLTHSTRMPRGSLATSARRRARAPGRVSARAHDPGTRADKARYVSEMFTCIVAQYALMTLGMHHGWRRARRSPSPRHDQPRARRVRSSLARCDRFPPGATWQSARVGRCRRRVAAPPPWPSAEFSACVTSRRASATPPEPLIRSSALARASSSGSLEAFARRARSHPARSRRTWTRT